MSRETARGEVRTLNLSAALKNVINIALHDTRDVLEVGANLVKVALRLGVLVEPLGALDECV